MKKAKDPITKCFRCGKDISKLSEDKVFDHMTIHNRDDIIAEYPELIEIDLEIHLEIHKKYGAEIKILFE